MTNVLVRPEDVDLEVNSTVEAVVIFSDKALVTRRLKAALKTGDNTVVFANLGDGIVGESIKAKIERSGVRLVSAESRTRQLYFYRSDEDRRVHDELIEGLKRAVRNCDERAVYSLENGMISELRRYIESALNAILLEQEVSLPRLSEALDFLAERVGANSGKLLDLNQEAEKTDEGLAALREKLQEIRRLDSRRQNSIELSVFADVDCEIDAEVSYILPGASWEAVYDSLLDTESGKLTISYYGDILQSTGEDWKNTRVSLSTAAVDVSMEIPRIYPVSLSAVYQKRTKTVSLVEKEIKKLEGADKEVGGQPEAEPPTGGETLGGDSTGKPEAVEAKKSTVSCLFEIQSKASIPPDGCRHKVLIRETGFDPALSFETVPEKMEYVYRKATLVNKSGLPFLAGRNSVFRNGSFIGHSAMKYIAVDEKFALSFGIDDDLRIRFVVMRDLYEPAKTVLSKNVYSKAYRYVLDNFKAKPEKVVVRQPVFISELGEVGVRIAEETTAGYSRDDEGVLQWEVEVAPGHSVETRRVLELHYTVEAPKSFDLSGIFR